MKVAKGGNSLTVRLPAAVVASLELVEGDEVEIGVTAEGQIEISRESGREAALAKLRALRRPLPPDYNFDREEANARGCFLRHVDSSLHRDEREFARRQIKRQWNEIDAVDDGPGLQPSELVRPEAQADGLGWYAAGLWPWVCDGAKEKQIPVRE